MSKTTAPRRPGGGVKLVLAGMGLSLAAMMAAILFFRLTGPGLVKRGPMQQTAVFSGMSSTEAPAGMEAMAAMMAGEGGVSEEEQTAMVSAMQRLQADPNDLEALLDLADQFMAQENFGSAQGFINRASVAAPSDPRPPYYQGILKTRQGDYRGAAEDMERSLQLLDSPATRYSLGNIYIYYLDETDRGVGMLKEALNASSVPQDLLDMIREELARHDAS